MNWSDKTLFVGDNLHVLRGMNSETVDLIYLDPPFNSNRSYCRAHRLSCCGRERPQHGPRD